MGNESKLKPIKMSEQQAIDRAEEIVHLAVDGMSPKPTLKPASKRVGACIAWDDHRPDDRIQVTRGYQLTGVSGAEAKKLVRQARDAWVKRGFRFTSADADGDWSSLFPSVDMRSEPDDFSVAAITGVMDRKTGDGLAAITVTSPCFLAVGSGTTSTTPSALHSMQNDERAERQVLAHSSRINDALRVQHAPGQHDQPPHTVQDADGTWLHHAWSTGPLTENEMVRAMERVQQHLARAGWTVRQMETRAGSPAVVARHAVDDSIAQIAPSSTGAVRVAVTVPAAAVLRTDV
ncbi:hypothetical protein ACFU7T_36095 [Streptomyces sp. NPDC057555]|uniref:hypothetical protein n=1 Tax=Streptomyces sp. NPDC057555 TaxID=3346166 RepID=UPI0036B44E58